MAESQRPPRVEITPESQRPPRVEITPERKDSVLRGEMSLAEFFGLPDNAEFDRFMRAVVAAVFPGLEAGSQGRRKEAEALEPKVRSYLERVIEKYSEDDIGLRGTTGEKRPFARTPPQESPIGDFSSDRFEGEGVGKVISPEKSPSGPRVEISRKPSTPSDEARTVEPVGGLGRVSITPDSPAPKKQTAPATKAARTDDEDAPAQEMGVRPKPRPERRSSDVDDLDESAASMENQMASLMGALAAQPGGVADVGTEPTAKTQRMRDEEIAAREPLGESAGRLAIQNFMERNFGFTPTVTFDVEEQEPGGSGSMF